MADLAKGQGKMIWLLAVSLLLYGGFVFTQGGSVVGPVLAGAGAIIILIKLIA
jgi:hypothetical protein